MRLQTFMEWDNITYNNALSYGAIWELRCMKIFDASLLFFFQTGQTCEGQCGKKLDTCSCHVTCISLENCCDNFKEFCVDTFPYSGSIFGGTDFVILNATFNQNSSVTCRYDLINHCLKASISCLLHAMHFYVALMNWYIQGIPRTLISYDTEFPLLVYLCRCIYFIMWILWQYTWCVLLCTLCLSLFVN